MEAAEDRRAQVKAAPPNPRRASIVLHLTTRQARALLAAADNSLTCQDDADSICGGKAGAGAAFAAVAKLRTAIYSR